MLKHNTRCDLLSLSALRAITMVAHERFHAALPAAKLLILAICSLALLTRPRDLQRWTCMAVLAPPLRRMLLAPHAGTLCTAHRQADATGGLQRWSGPPCELETTADELSELQPRPEPRAPRRGAFECEEGRRGEGRGGEGGEGQNTGFFFCGVQ